MTNEDREGLERESYRRRKRDTDWGPVMVIIIIAMIVFFNVNAPNSGADRGGNSAESDFSRSAFMSGAEYRSNGSAFRGGEATAIMGGVHIDLREASMEGSEATIHVAAIMGGADIRVPRSWKVVNRVSAILGGVNDRTRPVDAEKRLIIEGSVLMGGLAIKN